MTKTVYLNLDHWIRCLAHVVHLATQALIKTYLKAICFDPANLEYHIQDTNLLVWDEVGWFVQ